MNTILDYLKVFNNIDKRKPYEPRFMAHGGRIGFKRGNITTHPVTPLSKDEAKIYKMVQEKKLPHQKGVSASERLAQTYNKPWEELQSSQRRIFKQHTFPHYRELLEKTKGKVSRAQLSEILTEKFGRPISLGQIHGYGSNRLGQRQKTAFGKKLDELLDVKRITPKNPMYKIPTDADINKLESLLDITPSNSLKNSTVDNIVKLNKKYGSVYKSGKLPDLETVLKHFPEMTTTQASNSTIRLSQIYSGNKFKLFSNLDPKVRKAVENIKVDKKVGDKIFKLIGDSRFNEYHQSMYRISLGIIDEKLGNRKGTFEALKAKARSVLKENKIPIYDPKVKNSFGFNINEIAGVTGSAKSKAAEFSQFIDIMEGNLNQKTLANFQSRLSIARSLIEDDPSKLSSESKRINKLAKNLEDVHGIKLPRLRDPDATKYFSSTRLKQLEDQGLDIVKAAEQAGYTIEMPKGAVTVKEFTEQGPKAKKMLEIFKKANIPCVKGVGGNCTTPEDFRKGFNQLVKEAADGKGSKAAISKLTNFTKGMRGLKGVATVTGYGLLAEAGFMVPFAVGDYAAGKSWKRILGNATDFGFGPILGQSEQEEFEAALPEGSVAVEGEKAIELSEQLQALDEQTIRPQGRIGMDQARREESRDNVITGIEDEFSENLQPFLSDTPFAKDQWHQGMWTQAHQDAADARAQIAKENFEREQKRDLTLEGDYFGAATGGIMNLKKKW